MKRIKIFFLIQLFVLTLFGQTENEILWKENKKLVWDDFQAKPQMGHKASALTNASAQFYLQQEGKKLKIDTRVFFRKDGSWVKPDAHQDNLLQHEQTHFDIYELFGRKYRKYISELNTNKAPQKLVDKMAKSFKKYQKKAKKMQDKYDKQTNYSRNIEEQKKWSTEINKKLLLLNKFSNPFIEISIL